MNFMKRIVSITLIIVLALSVVGATTIEAMALSENARYYESIPETAYATVGVPFKIYYNNVLSLPGLRVVFNVPEELSMSYYDDKIEITAELPGDFTVPWRVYDSEYVLVSSGQMKFMARDLTLKDATALVLGDSTVKAGVITEDLLDYYEENGKKLTLLGTRGVAPNLHEGRSGWTASMYCSTAQSGLTENKFYNNGFDFSHYMNSNGYKSVDYVIVQLGINDIKGMNLENYSSAASIESISKIVESIKAFDPNISVIIGVTIPSSEDVSDFNDVHVFSSEFEYRNNIIHFASDLMNHFAMEEGVYLSPINCVIDTKNEMEDAIHPTEVGYRNIAEQHLSTINCIYNKEIKVKPPVINSATSAHGAITLKWGATYGAKKYYILRNNEVIAETTKLKYNDISVVSGTQYSYKIKAVCENGDEHTSAVKYATYISVPELKSAKPAQNGVKLEWGSSAGAKEYYVYRKTTNGKWARVLTTTATSGVDKTAKSGTKYFYTVKAASGTNTSNYNTTGISLYFIATPKLTSVSNMNNCTVVKWGAVKGAKTYNVYRKSTKTESWKKIGTTASTSFTDKTVKSGGNYYYTVKAYNGNITSSYNTAGLVTKYLSIPKLTKVESKVNGVNLYYNAVEGATGYTIYRKTGNGSWVKIATVSGKNTVKYVDKTAKRGVTYTYTVRATNGKYVSYYNTKGLTIKDRY